MEVSVECLQGWRQLGELKVRSLSDTAVNVPFLELLQTRLVLLFRDATDNLRPLGAGAPLTACRLLAAEQQLSWAAKYAKLSGKIPAPKIPGAVCELLGARAVLLQQLAQRFVADGAVVRWAADGIAALCTPVTVSHDRAAVAFHDNILFFRAVPPNASSGRRHAPSSLAAAASQCGFTILSHLLATLEHAASACDGAAWAPALHVAPFMLSGADPSTSASAEPPIGLSADALKMLAATQPQLHQRPTGSTGSDTATATRGPSENPSRAEPLESAESKQRSLRSSYAGKFRRSDGRSFTTMQEYEEGRLPSLHVPSGCRVAMDSGVQIQLTVARVTADALAAAACGDTSALREACIECLRGSLPFSLLHTGACEDHNWELPVGQMHGRPGLEEAVAAMVAAIRHQGTADGPAAVSLTFAVIGCVACEAALCVPIPLLRPGQPMPHATMQHVMHHAYSARHRRLARGLGFSEVVAALYISPLLRGPAHGGTGAAHMIHVNGLSTLLPVRVRCGGDDAAPHPSQAPAPPSLDWLVTSAADEVKRERAPRDVFDPPTRLQRHMAAAVLECGRGLVALNQRRGTATATGAAAALWAPAATFFTQASKRLREVLPCRERPQDLASAETLVDAVFSTAASLMACATKVQICTRRTKRVRVTLKRLRDDDDNSGDDDGDDSPSPSIVRLAAYVREGTDDGYLPDHGPEVRALAQDAAALMDVAEGLVQHLQDLQELGAGEGGAATRAAACVCLVAMAGAVFDAMASAPSLNEPPVAAVPTSELVPAIDGPGVVPAPAVFRLTLN